MSLPSASIPSNSGKSVTQTRRSPPSVHGRAPQVESQRPQHVVGHGQLAGHDEQQVAGVGGQGLDQRLLLLGAHELGDGGVEDAALLHPHPHQAGRPQLLGLVGEAVERGPAGGTLAGHPDALDRGGLEGAETGFGEHRLQVDQLHPEAQVGLVGAEAVLGLPPRHVRGLAGVVPAGGLDGGDHRLVDEGDDIVLVDERGLGVELGELELAVGPQVLVPEALGQLVVAVDAADHQQLLEQLGALRQGVEVPGLEPGRHHEVAGALGRRRHQQRGLDLDEALVVHGPADGAGHRGPQPQVALHGRPAKVEVAVAQPEDLVGVDPVRQRERRRLGHRQDLHRAVAHLDLAGVQAGVDGALGPGPHRPGDPQDVLRPQLRRAVDDALDDAGVVPQVDEGQVLPVLAPAGHPAAERHRRGRCRPCPARRSSRCASSGFCSRNYRREGVESRAESSGTTFHASRFRTWSTTSARGTTSWSWVRRSRRVDRALGRLPLAHHQGQTGAGTVGRLELALHRPAVEGPVGADPGFPEGGGEGDRGCSVDGVDDEHLHRTVGRRGRPPRRRRPAAAARCPSRTRCLRSQGRRGPRPACRSDRRRPPRSGPSRAPRRPARTSCGCSSRGPEPAGARSGRARRAGRARAGPGRNGRRTPRTGGRPCGARRRLRHGRPAACSRGPAAGCRRTARGARRTARRRGRPGTSAGRRGRRGGRRRRRAS